MNAFQVAPGRPRPYSGPPAAFFSAAGLSLPTHTAALTCGVNPAIHASELYGVEANCWVPVFAADGRPPASGTLEYPATGSIAYVGGTAYDIINPL